MNGEAATFALSLCLTGGVMPWLVLVIAFSLTGLMRKVIDLLERKMSEWM